MTLRLAWRNLWRNKRRTLITLLTVSFGVFLSVTFTGVGGYMYTLIIDSGVKAGLGHLTVQKEGMQENPSLKKRIRGWEKARELALEKGATAAVPRIQGPAMFSTATRSLGGLFVALDPAMETGSTSQFLESLKEGAMFEGPEGEGAVIGAKMAEKLKLKLGKKMVVTFTDIHGETASLLTRISGIFKTGVDEADNALVLLPLNSAAQGLGYAPGEVGALAVFLKDQRGAKGMAEILRQELALQDAEIMTWTETQRDLAELVKVDKAFNYFFQLVLGLLVAIGILNTVLMSVMERKREFGVMLALGLSPGLLFRLVVLESLCLGLAGLGLGSLLSTPWVLFLAGPGLDLSASVAPDGIDAGSVLIKPIYHILLYPQHAAVIGLTLLTLTLLAGIYPAWKAGRVPPLESIRNLG